MSGTQDNSAEQFDRHGSSKESPGFISDAVRSLGYSAIQAPINGIVQLYDHVAGSHHLPDVQIIDPCKPAAFGSWNWHAQQIGGAAGMAADFFLAGNAVGLACRAGSAVLGLEAASTATAGALATAETSVCRSALKNAVVGFGYDSLCAETPKENTSNFWSARFKQGLTGAATFGALGGASELPFLRNLSRSTRSALAGIPAGITHANVKSLLDNKGFASLNDMAADAYGFAVVGKTMGALHESLESRQTKAGALDSEYEAKAVEHLKKLMNEQRELRENSVGRLTLSLPDAVELPDRLPPDIFDLTLQNCSNLKRLPELPPGLEALTLTGCTSLEELPENLPPRLKQLTISQSPIERLPANLPAGLDYLSLEGCGLKELPGNLPPNLLMLMVENCSRLASLPDTLPSSIEFMRLGGETKLPNKLPQNLTSLQLEQRANLSDVPLELPPELRDITLDGELVSSRFITPDVKLSAKIVRHTADAIFDKFGTGTHMVFLGRDAAPLVPVLRQMGANAQYFLWSRLQSETPALRPIAERQWLKEVPSNSVVIDTGYNGSIIDCIKTIDPTATGYLIHSAGKYPTLPGIATTNQRIIYDHLESLPKITGRCTGYREDQGLCRTQDRDPEEIVVEPRRAVRFAEDLYRELGLPESQVELYKAFTGCSPKQRLGLDQFARSPISKKAE